jgi:hypothetical protein
MHRYEFKPDDLFVNRLKTYPEYNIFIYQGEMFVNRDSRISGSGGIVVYDVNTNRTDSADKIYPFVVSGSEKPAFKSQQYQPLIKNHSGDFQWASAYVGGVARESVTRASNAYSGVPTFQLNGETAISSSYGFESPISRLLTHTTGGYQADYFDIVAATTGSSGSVEFSAATNLYTSALQNVARKYTTLSDHFIFKSSSVRSRDLVTTDGDNINFIFIPSMYYGSTIKKGSVELNYYITGSKIASCADVNHNGTLIGTTGSTSGSVVGIVMYDEGVIMLTSSVELESNDIEYVPSTPTSGSWLYYGTTLNDSTGSTNTLASASYDLNFKGTSYVNSMTMFAHARKGHLNHSNNPTYKDLSFTPSHQTGSGKSFVEGDSPIANIVSGSYVSASFDKTTYISKVHIYDEDGNLIAITSMASPVKKTLEDEFTFKMKLDL